MIVYENISLGLLNGKMRWSVLSNYLKHERGVSDATLRQYLRYYRKVRDALEGKPFNKERCDILLDGVPEDQLRFYLIIIRHIGHIAKLAFVDDYKFPVITRKKVTPLTQKEVLILANYKTYKGRDKKNLNRRYKTIILFLYSTGIRFAELRRIRWEDVGHGVVFINSVKREDNRYIPVSKELIEEIEKLPKYKHGYVFGHFKGPIDHATLNAELKKRGKALGFGRVTAHLLRHSFITDALRRNQSIAKIRRITGHRKIESLMWYENLVFEDLRDVVPALDF